MYAFLFQLSRHHLDERPRTVLTNMCVSSQDFFRRGQGVVTSSCVDVLFFTAVMLVCACLPSPRSCSAIRKSDVQTQRIGISLVDNAPSDRPRESLPREKLHKARDPSARGGMSGLKLTASGSERLPFEHEGG